MNSFEDPRFVLFKNLVENLNEFCVLSDKLKERSIIFWTNISINPNPNSTADNMRKKKVNDNKFKLSNIRPITKAAA